MHEGKNNETGSKNPIVASIEMQLMRNQHTFRGTLLAVRLHGDVRIKMIQGTVSLLTAIPSTFIHALNFFVTSSRTLVLLGAGNGYERVNL